MTTVLLYIGGFLVLVVLLDMIPGVRHLISPLLSGLAAGINFTVGSIAGWSTWFVKTLFQDHALFLRHLTHTRAQVDPSDPYRHPPN